MDLHRVSQTDSVPSDIDVVGLFEGGDILRWSARSAHRDGTRSPII